MAWIAALIGLAGNAVLQEQAKKNQPPQIAPVAGQTKAPAQSVFGTNVPDRQSAPITDPTVKQFTPASLIGSLLQPSAATADKDLGAAANAQVGNPIGSNGPITGKPGGMDWKTVMQGIPEAMAVIGPMLMDRQQRPTVLPAQGGGQGGSVVPGFGLPTQGMRRPTIGELLNALPRPRYG